MFLLPKALPFHSLEIFCFYPLPIADSQGCRPVVYSLISAVFCGDKDYFCRLMQSTISYKRIWAVAYPIILGSMAQNLINFTDTAFLGRVGEVALGGGALGGIFYLAVYMLGLGFGQGEQIVVARRHGENKPGDIGSVVNQSFLFLIGLSFVAFIILRYGSVLILDYGVKSAEVHKATTIFLKYRSFGIFFAFINVVFRSFYIGLGRTKIISYNTFLLAIVNIVFDYLLIFGKAGFPQMGIAGAAIASVMAEVAAMIHFAIYTRYFVDVSAYGLFRKLKLEYERMVRILKVAIPTMVQQFVSLSVWFVFFLFVEKLGKSSLAVSNIIRSIYVILMVPIWGYATASNTLVSYLIGQGESKLVMKLVYKIALLSVGSVMIIVLLSFGFAKDVLSIYTNDPTLIALGIPVFKVVSVGACLLSLGFVFLSGVAGTGKTNISLYVELLVLTMYLAYTYAVVEIFHGNVTVAWTAEWLYGSMISLVSWAYLKTNRWKAHKI